MPVVRQSRPAGTFIRVIGPLFVAAATISIVVAACGSTSATNTLPGSSQDVGGSPATIRVQAAYVLVTMPTEPAAGYLVLVNDSDVADALVSVSSPAFGSIGLHQTAAMSSDPTASGGMDGMVGMQPVAEIAIPARGTQALAPGGYHLMLEDPTGSLTAGTKVDLTLTFRHAPPVTVAAEVRATASGG